jgi:hypothetical protein
MRTSFSNIDAMNSSETALSFLFVHLGTPPPKILERNIEHLKQHFRGIPIKVASDLDSTQFPYLESTEHIDIRGGGTWTKINSSPYDVRFRKGYWLHTIRRLGVIADAHKLLGEGKLLHLESDMLLLPNFPITEFQGKGRLAWLRWTENGDMPGLIYSPSLEASLWLGATLVHELGSSVDQIDATIMRRLGLRYPNNINYLPDGAEFIEDPVFRTEGGSWIFDSLAFGAYLIGTDPRHRWGISRRLIRYPSSSVVDPRLFSYRCTSKGLEVSDKETDRIFYLGNLHVHSKDLSVFSKGSEFDFFEQLGKKINRESKLRFFFWGFWQSLIEFFDALSRKMGY